ADVVGETDEPGADAHELFRLRGEQLPRLQHGRAERVLGVLGASAHPAPTQPPELRAMALPQLPECGRLTGRQPGHELLVGSRVPGHSSTRRHRGISLEASLTTLSLAPKPSRADGFETTGRRSGREPKKAYHKTPSSSVFSVHHVSGKQIADGREGCRFASAATPREGEGRGSEPLKG